MAAADGHLRPVDSEFSGATVDLVKAKTEGAYIDRLRKHVLGDTRHVLYHEHDYQPLLKFLSSVPRQPSASPDQPPSPGQGQPETFAWVRYIVDDPVSAAVNLNSPTELDEKDGAWSSYTSCGHLVFIRGYPSPPWLERLGTVYHVDAEFWRRHLNFLATSPNDILSGPSLPSANCAIISLRITTIGTRNKSTETERAHVDRLRHGAARAMEKYHTDLRLGNGWRTGDSIVRNYTVYDSGTFSIEQIVTVCLNGVNREMKYWQVLIYTDCGKGLRASPHGPWLGDPETRTVDEDAHLLPLTWHCEKITTDADQGQRSDGLGPTDHVEHAFAQNVENLHLNLGRILNNDTMRADPFYAISDLFRLASIAEAKFLNMIARQLEKATSRLLTLGHEPDPNAAEDNIHAQSDLVRYRQLLENHINDIRENLSVIHRQRELQIWPALDMKQGEERVAVESLNSFEHDFKHLLERAEDLYKRCESATTIAMSSASIAESRRSLVQAKSLFKFTVLASFYVPLSFTSSLLGMNVTQLTNGSVYGVWLFFAITLPIFAASALFLFVDWRKVHTVCKKRLEVSPM